jgi:hypothetical protein
MGRDTFSAIISQSHLVTLLVIQPFAAAATSGRSEVDRKLTKS